MKKKQDKEKKIFYGWVLMLVFLGLLSSTLLFYVQKTDCSMTLDKVLDDKGLNDPFSLRVGDSTVAIYPLDYNIVCEEGVTIEKSRSQGTQTIRGCAYTIEGVVCDGDGKMCIIDPRPQLRR